MQRIMELLVHFQYNADLDTFKHIFGSVGEHLWGKYNYHKDSSYLNVIALYSGLDTANRRALEQYLQFNNMGVE